MKSLAVNPDTVLLIPTSRVVGGRETRSQTIRNDQSGNRIETERNVTTIVSDIKERKRAEAIVASAVHVIRRSSTHTMIGYLAPKSALDSIMVALDSVKGEAIDFNGEALTCRVEIGALPIEISIAMGPECARALADHVRSEIEALANTLRAGDANATRAILLRTKNLGSLAVGPQAEAITFAIQEGADRLRALKDAIKRGETPESAGRALDLGMIESAQGMFTYGGEFSAEGQIESAIA